MWVGSEKDRQSKHREYERHRRNYPKTDVEFLDANSRRNRILTTEDQLVSQCKKFIEIADRCEACILFENLLCEHRFEFCPFYWVYFLSNFKF